MDPLCLFRRLAPGPHELINIVFSFIRLNPNPVPAYLTLPYTVRDSTGIMNIPNRLPLKTFHNYTIPLAGTVIELGCMWIFVLEYPFDFRW